MQLSSSYAIIQDRFSPAEGNASRMMRVPQGARPEQVPAGWRIAQMAHNLYYGLRLLEEGQMEGGGACTL